MHKAIKTFKMTCRSRHFNFSFLGKNLNLTSFIYLVFLETTQMNDDKKDKNSKDKHSIFNMLSAKPNIMTAFLMVLKAKMAIEPDFFTR